MNCLLVIDCAEETDLQCFITHCLPCSGDTRIKIEEVDITLNLSMCKCSNVVCYAQFALATLENDIHRLLEDSLHDMTNTKVIRMKQYLPNWLLKVVNRLLSLSSVTDN